MMKRLTLIAALLIGGLSLQAQTRPHHDFDKGDADDLVYEQLSVANILEHWHQPVVISKDRLMGTDHKEIYRMPGTSFQIDGLRSDCYVRKHGGVYSMVYDQRYPVESTVNLLMNQIQGNDHKLTLHHHLYGNRVKTLSLKMQTVYDVLGRHTEMFCHVTKVTPDVIEADLVLHHKGRNFIHLFVMQLPVNQIFLPEGTFTAHLYSNIPQDNIKSIYSNK